MTDALITVGLYLPIMPFSAGKFMPSLPPVPAEAAVVAELSHTQNFTNFSHQKRGNRNKKRTEMQYINLANQ